MPTKLSTILGRVRSNLQEPVADLWTDDELLDDINAGIKDMWRSLNGQYQNFYFEVSDAVTYTSDAGVLANVPTNVSTILGLELVDPRLYPSLEFVYKDYNSDEFKSARAAQTMSPTVCGRVLICATGAGAPTGAPTIYIAPRLSADLELSLSFIPILLDKAGEQVNPVPGESDLALECWATAYARAKIRDSQTPDPEWLALYATEKTNILVAVTPRQEITDQISESPFGEY